MKRKYYCDSCKKMVDVREHLSDIVCETCHYLIATFQEPPSQMITFWHGGHFKVWPFADAFYARNDPDWLTDAAVKDVLGEIAEPSA